MPFCPKCDGEVKEDQDYCDNCGEELSEKNYVCDFCDKEFQSKDRLKKHQSTHSVLEPKVLSKKLGRTFSYKNLESALQSVLKFSVYLIIVIMLITIALAFIAGVFLDTTDETKLQPEQPMNKSLGETQPQPEQPVDEPSRVGATKQEFNLRPTNTVYQVYIHELPSGVNERYRSAPGEAITFWEKNTDYTFKKVDDKEDADIYFTWVKEFGGKLGHTLYEDFVQVALGDSKCYGEWKPFAYDTVVSVSAHELGHTLGFEHVDNRESIMYPQIGSVSYVYDVNKTEVIPGEYFQFFPVCTRKEKATYTVSVKGDENFDVYMVPSKKEYNNFLEDESFSYYADCYKKDASWAKISCTVGNEAGLVIRNPNSDALRINIRMEEK